MVNGTTRNLFSLSAHHHLALLSVLCLWSIFLRAEGERDVWWEGIGFVAAPRRSLPPSLTEFVLWLERAFNFRRREARRGEETEERRGKQSRGERERNNTDQLPKGRFMGLFCIWRENNPEGGATDFPCFCMIRQSGLGCPDGGKARSKNELKLSNRLEFRGF